MTKPKSAKKPTKAANAKIEKQFERALAASLKSQPEVAIADLNEVLQRDPYHARARHLLGAEYAQAGKIDDALLEMATALELNPDMPLARFQLGLLLITCARTDDAAKVWAPLDALGADHVLNRFRSGMMQMVQGHFEPARQVLAIAIAENTELPALNREMAIVIDTIDVAIADAAKQVQKPVEKPAEMPEEQVAEDPNAQHILVSSYVQSPTVH